jgi:hypothetical protein
MLSTPTRWATCTTGRVLQRSVRGFGVEMASSASSATTAPDTRIGCPSLTRRRSSSSARRRNASGSTKQPAMRACSASSECPTTSTVATPKKAAKRSFTKRTRPVRSKITIAVSTAESTAERKSASSLSAAETASEACSAASSCSRSVRDRARVRSAARAHASVDAAAIARRVARARLTRWLTVPSPCGALGALGSLGASSGDGRGRGGQGVGCPTPPFRRRLGGARRNPRP